MKTMLAGVVLLAATASARADEVPIPPIDPVEPIEPAPLPVPEPPPAPTTPTTIDIDVTTPVVMPETRYNRDNPDRLGFALTAGGGVAGFTGDVMRETTKDGGNWDVRAMIGTRLPIALEAAYMGSAQQIHALGLDSNAMLVGNGIQGDLRINATTDMAIQPFLYGGVAWRRYTLDARAEFRGSFHENLVPANGSGNAFADPANLNRWGINANLGYEF